MSSLWELVERRAAASPGGLLAVDERDRRMTFAELRAAAERAAGGLAELGAGPGVTVAWMLPARIEALVVMAALARLGARQVPLLPTYGERELRFIGAQTGMELVLVPSSHRGVDLPRLAAGVGLRPVLVDSLPEAEPPPPGAPVGDWVFYTSGTTADPKGVIHGDATLLAAAGGLVRAFELGPDDRAALVFPIAHVGGALWLMAGLMSGAGAILVERFDDAAIDTLARHGVTQAGAGTVFHQAYLRAQRSRGGRLFPRVRAFPGGGAPKPPSLHAELKRELGGAGIVSGYGLTECPAVTMGSVRDADEKLARTEGRASPAGAAIRIVDGEIRVRGPQLFRGYVDRALDRDAFDADGFFRTGDLGELDPDGHLVVTGRLKDVIIRKGENISAREIEDLLHAHPAVAEAAVIGVPDPELGERCCAVVVPRGKSPRLEELCAYLAQVGLMRQKLPERLEIVDALPRNASGKVEKRALRARFAPC